MYIMSIDIVSLLDLKFIITYFVYDFHNDVLIILRSKYKGLNVPNIIVCNNKAYGVSKKNL